MRIFFCAILFSLLSLGGYSQTKQPRPKTVGIIQEFNGIVTNSVQYDGDNFFTLEDVNKKEIDFYFSASGCFPEGDPEALEVDIDSELSDLLIDVSSAPSPIKVKVTAKSTYGYFCLPCDECEQEKVIIWRPTKVVRIN